MAIDGVREEAGTMEHVDAKTDQPSVYMRSVALGFVSGLRSATPMALLSLLSRRHASSLPPLQYLDTSAARIITATMAVGELVGDKLPFIPGRLTPGPLAGRLIIGALVGWAICRQAERSPIVGALLGALGAASGSVAGYYARAWLRKVTKLPDPVLGGAEDLLALGLGYLAARKV